MASLNFLNIFFASATGSGFITLIYKFIEKWFDDWLNQRRLKLKDKKVVMLEVIKICTEGDSHSYAILPRSSEHIHFIANRLEGFNKKMANSMRIYLSSWYLCAQQQTKRNKFTKKDLDFCRELQTRAKEQSDFLIKQASKLK